MSYSGRAVGPSQGFACLRGEHSRQPVAIGQINRVCRSGQEGRLWGCRRPIATKSVDDPGCRRDSAPPRLAVECGNLIQGTDIDRKEPLDLARSNIFQRPCIDDRNLHRCGWLSKWGLRCLGLRTWQGDHKFCHQEGSQKPAPRRQFTRPAYRSPEVLLSSPSCEAA